jgi:hypothetical protein
MNKYMFRVTRETRHGQEITIHEFFGETQESAYDRARARFGDDAEIEFLKQTG